MKSPLPVLTMPHSIAFERPTAPKPELRRRFNLPERSFLFLSLFDLNSYAARKNPGAALAAFARSGLGRDGAGLVLKVQNTAANPDDYAALRAAVAEVPGALLIAETLSRADVYALEAACDCFVSLHRSEGFGLAVAECMYLGLPVIATDWSATAEFLDERTGYPVSAGLVTLEQSHGPYGKGSTWAEPDSAHAVARLRQVFANPAEAAERGARGRATIETRFSPAAIGARYRQRLESIAAF